MRRSTDPATASSPGLAPDGGFTLAELLIVIVVLGILATVTVFAVRGITDQGTESSCANELRILTTAEEANATLNDGDYADEGALVASGAITSESSMYDIAVGFDGSYSIAPAAGSSCTGSASSVASGPPSPGPILPTSINFGTLPAWQYGTNGDDEVVVLGRSEGEYDFVVTINDAPPTSRRVTFINLDLIADDGDIDYIMNRSRTNGLTDWAIYSDDDTSTIVNSGGGTWASVQAYMTTVVAGDGFHHLDSSGFDLTDLLEIIG